MAYKCSFVDEVLYGPEDVNEVVGDLVGAGVAPFISKDSFNPSDLNSLTADMVISGVRLGGCIVSRVSDTVVSVAPGIIYFGNGLRLKVTEAHSITVPENEEVTIYARYISSLGTAELTYTTLSITKDNYNIPLALISADGTIKDAREFAESKIATLGTNSVYVIPDDRITIYDYGKEPFVENVGRIGAEINLRDVNINRFNFLIFMFYEREVGSSGVPKYTFYKKYWEFKVDKICPMYNDYSYNTDEYIVPTSGTPYIKRDFNKFFFVVTKESVSDRSRLEKVLRNAIRLV